VFLALTANLWPQTWHPENYLRVFQKAFVQGVTLTGVKG
jgi:hypothetical protein